MKSRYKIVTYSCESPTFFLKYWLCKKNKKNFSEKDFFFTFSVTKRVLYSRHYMHFLHFDQQTFQQLFLKTWIFLCEVGKKQIDYVDRTEIRRWVRISHLQQVFWTQSLVLLQFSNISIHNQLMDNPVHVHFKIVLFSVNFYARITFGVQEEGSEPVIYILLVHTIYNAKG